MYSWICLSKCKLKSSADVMDFLAYNLELKGWVELLHLPFQSIFFQICWNVSNGTINLPPVSFQHSFPFQKRVGEVPAGRCTQPRPEAKGNLVEQKPDRGSGWTWTSSVGTSCESCRTVSGLGFWSKNEGGQSNMNKSPSCHKAVWRPETWLR